MSIEVQGRFELDEIWVAEFELDDNSGNRKPFIRLSLEDAEKIVSALKKIQAMDREYDKWCSFDRQNG